MRIGYDKKFLFLLFIIGLLATFSYGAYLDQDSEQKILFSNMKEYMIQIPGVTSLEHDICASNIVEISNSIERDHGIAAYYPLSPCMWYLNSFAPNIGNLLWHLYTYTFIFLIGCRSLYYFAKDIFQSPKTASFVTLIFFFTPRIFAESHYNNKDMILLAFMFALFWSGWRLLNKCTTYNAISFAVCGAFAFNTKIIGAWVFGIIGIYILLKYLFTKQFTKHVFSQMCLCILLWLGIYILITPACWSNILDFFKYLFTYAINFERWRNYILFQGKMLHTEYTGIPHKYLPTLILLTVPVGILLLIFAGGIWLFWDLFRGKFKNLFSKEGYISITVLSGLVPLLYAILAQTTVYNGWRHFYFSYASMIICAGYCAYDFTKHIKKDQIKKIMYGTGITYVVFLAISIGINHPQEHSYYNWIAGNNLETLYELDYWDLSVRQAYDLIEKDLTEKETTSVSALNIFTMWGLEINWNILSPSSKENIDIVTEWEQASYIIINTTYAHMYNAKEYDRIKQNYLLLGKISSYGNTVCEVYKHP